MGGSDNNQDVQADASSIPGPCGSVRRAMKRSESQELQYCLTGSPWVWKQKQADSEMQSWLQVVEMMG